MSEGSIVCSRQSTQPYLNVFNQFDVDEKDVRGVQRFDEDVEESRDGLFEVCGALALGDDRILDNVLLEMWSVSVELRAQTTTYSLEFLLQIA